MKIKYCLSNALALLFVAILCSQSYSFGKVRIKEYTPKATIYIFLGTECPFSQNYTKTLNDLYEKYKASNMEFIAVFPNPDDSKKKIREFTKTYKIKFEVRSDSKHELTNLHAATITPEVVVLNSKQIKVYAGKIDNWAEELGVRRNVITEHYLEDALSSIDSNTTIKIKATKAVGCFIHMPNTHENHMKK